MHERLTGEIYSFTVLDGDTVPEGFAEFAPLVLAMVNVKIPDFEGRKRDSIMMTMPVTDLDPNYRFSDQVKIDQKGEVIVRKHRDGGGVHVITYGQSFRISEEDRVDMEAMNEDGNQVYLNRKKISEARNKEQFIEWYRDMYGDGPTPYDDYPDWDDVMGL